MKNKKFKWITFDLDGTLMQNPFVGWVFPEIEAAINQLSATKLEVKQRLVDEHQSRMDRQEYVAAYDWDDMVRRLVTEEQLAVELDVAQLVQKHSTDGKIYLLEEGILETLDRLKQKGYKLAAVTNGFYKYQFPVLKALGLAQYFDEVLTPDRVGTGKPDVQIFTPLQDTGEIIAHVGDRVDHDVVAGKQLGVKTILIHRKLPEELVVLSPVERSVTPQGRTLVEEKLEKELGIESIQNTLNANPDIVRYPDVIIRSIAGELIQVIDQD